MMGRRKSKKTVPKIVSDDDIVAMDSFNYMARWRKNLLNVKVVDIDEASNEYEVMTEGRGNMV
jgi:hypothetical protein